MKKIVIFGATGAIGKHVASLFEGEGNSVVSATRKSAEYPADIEKPATLDALYKKLGRFDAVVSTAGEVAFAPLDRLSPENWQQSFHSKLMGQIEIVRRALPFIADGGSFTLISGVLSDAHIAGGAVASTVNSALEGFVAAAACELPRGLRINIVSPNLIEDSVEKYGAYFPGFPTVSGKAVAQAYKRSVFGVETGKVYRV